MFTDLVNSTALSDRMDPEDFRVLIEAHRTVAAAPIKLYDGVVARYLGDGMLIYFGYPEAHEDDPERAVRAGLEIVLATKAMNKRWVGEGRGKIAVRIGIHTGIVVVGDVIKRDVQEPMAVFGNAPSLAARLQALAQPNSVVLSGATKALLRPTVRCLPHGQTTLKGIAKPVEIFTASAGKGRSISDPATGKLRTAPPFVNRQKELSALRRGWTSAKNGKGKAILLAGDPGIGKSRLIRVVEEQVASKSFRWLVARTSPYATNSDFFAFSELFHELLQPADPENTDAKGYALLTSVLTEQGVDDPAHGLGFANLLGVDIPENVTAHSLQPERLRDLTLGAITGWFEQQSAAQPLVLVIEDLHWVDASTLEAIKLLLAKLASNRILMVMSSREHAVLGDVEQNIQTLSIERLPPGYAKTLLDHVVHNAGLPKTAIDTLLERANGVPLFLEELPKPVLEGGAGRAGLHGGDDPITLPSTLRDSLMAQLDRLGEGKAVAQYGAVLGDRFDEALLRRVWSGGSRSLDEGIASLTDAALLSRRGKSPEATFEFKHALLAEIAYDSLLRQNRRQIHRHAADALVAHFQSLAEARPELIARHYAAAGDAIVAFDYWMKAGNAAARRSANTEAIGHLRSAEAELERLKVEGVKDLDERWLELYVVRAPVLIALSGWSAPEVEETYRATLTLSDTLGVRQLDQFNCWAGLNNVHLLRGNLAEARSAADRMNAIALELDAQDLKQRWHRMSALCEFLAARFDASIKHHEAALALNSPDQPANHTILRGINPDVITYSIKAWTHWFLGESDRSHAASSAAIDTAEAAQHPFSRGYALCLGSSLDQCRGKASSTLSYAEEALSLSVEYGFPYWYAWASVTKGWAIAALGDPDRGISILIDGIARYEATDASQMHGYNLCLLSETYQLVNRLDDSIKTAKLAIAEMERTGIVFYLPEAYRLLGESLLQNGKKNSNSLRMLTRALRISEEQQSFSLFASTYGALFRQKQFVRLQKTLEDRAQQFILSIEQRCMATEAQQAKQLLIVKSQQQP